MNGAAHFWRNVSLGVFLLAVGTLLALDLFWPWILVVLCGMSFLRSVFRGDWRFCLHPLLWGLGISASILAGERIGVCTALILLAGASVILAYLVSLVPRRAPRDPRRAPGARIVLDAEAVSSTPVDPPP